MELFVCSENPAHVLDHWTPFDQAWFDCPVHPERGRVKLPVRSVSRCPDHVCGAPPEDHPTRAQTRAGRETGVCGRKRGEHFDLGPLDEAGREAFLAQNPGKVTDHAFVDSDNTDPSTGLPVVDPGCSFDSIQHFAVWHHPFDDGRTVIDDGHGGTMVTDVVSTTECQYQAVRRPLLGYRCDVCGGLIEGMTSTDE